MTFVLFAGGIAAVGYLVFQSEKNERLEEEKDELTAVANLKVALISNWRKERLEDGDVFLRNPLAARMLDGMVRRDSHDPPDEETRSWFDSVRKHHEYRSIHVLDASGQVRLSIPEDGNGLRMHMLAQAKEAIAADRTILSDLHQTAKEDAVHIHLASPLTLGEGAGRTPIGAIILTIDPNVSLFPLLENWPTASRTAETLLVRREGDEVAFLSNLRYREDAPRDLHFPIDEKSPPAAMAARGEEGFVEGKDYRGVQVLALIRKVPDSPWALVAKMDREEYEAPVRGRARVVGLVVLALILAAGLGVTAIWHNERAREFREKYKAEVKHQALARHFEFLTKHANDIILLVDEDLKIIEANDRAVEIYGYPLDELLEKRVPDLRAPETRALFEEDLARTRNEDGFYYETVHQTKDGRRFPVEVSARRIEIDGKQFLTGVLRDITERKRAEERIKRINRSLSILSECNRILVRAESEERLLEETCKAIQLLGGFRLVWIGYAEEDEMKTIRTMAKSGFDEGYLDGAAITWSDSERGRGPTGTAIRTGKPVVVRDVSTAPEYEPWREEALKGGYASSIALPLNVGNRAIGALSIRASEPDASDPKEVDMLAELANDIAYGIASIRARTERQQAMEALRRSEELFRATFEQAAVGIVQADLQGRPVRVNDQVCDILGYSREELQTHSFPELTHPDDLPMNKAAFVRLLSGESRAVSLKKRYVRKDQGVVWCNLTATLLRSPNGDPEYIISILKDITKELEMEKQVRQWQKMEAIGQLTGGIAHDFNNILQVVLAYSTFVSNELDPASRECNDLAQVIKAASRGADLTRQLLAFSRQSDLSITEFDVRPLIKEVAKMLERTIPTSISINFQFGEALPQIKADPSQIHQVLLNLCINAKDAMPHGGQISLSAYHAALTGADCWSNPDASPGKFVVIEVADTGTGISEEHLSHIFEPFFTTKEQGKGTGLGLASAYGIVKQHGGFLTCESTVGKGTVFHVWIPAGAEAPSAEASQIICEGLQGGTECLLVADDQDAILAMLHRGLEGLGYQVLTATNGIEALDVFRINADHIALVLLDLQMPEMDGETCLEKIHGLAPDTKVLVASGFVDPDHGERLRQMGVRDILLKPYTFTQLAQTVRATLDS